MRMTVTRITYHDGMTCVEGMTSIGTIGGVWHPKRILPVLNRVYFVELSMDAPGKSEIAIIRERHFHPGVERKENTVEVKTKNIGIYPYD